MHATRTRAASHLVLVLVCTAQLMVVLDVSVVNVALPSIRSSLETSATQLPWVAHAYTLTLGGLLLLGGRLADLHGHARVFALGLVLFCAASLLGGLSSSPGQLVLARAVQGVGAAILAPATLTILTSSFPEGRARVRALAAWTAVGVAGGAAGNLVGGALTEALSWRAVLLVNVPVGAVALALGLRLLGARRPSGPGGGLDLPGAMAATGGLTALVYGLTRATAQGWGDPVTVAALAAGTLALVLFAVVEFRSPLPLLPPRILRRRAISVGGVMMFLAGACFQVPMWYFLTFYMQDELGFGALRTGLGFLPHTLVTMAVGWLLTPRLMRVVDPRVLVAVGGLASAAGFAWQAAAVSEHTYVSAVLGPAVVVSVGAGLFNTPLTALVTSGTATRDAGAVSGLVNAAKQVGGAVGLAALATASTSGSASAAIPYTLVFCLIAALQLLVAVLASALPRGARV